MPYTSTADLPESIRKVLPQHAQEIYLKAFNSASEKYEEEGTMHAVAWKAVKTSYKKEGGKWVRK